MPERFLLTLDTSSPHLTMGLYGLAAGQNNIQILAESSIDNDSQRYHSSMLMPALTSLFESAGIQIKDLTDLAIHIGPGSFTGIRTGLISARTLGQFLPVTAHAMNAFELGVFSASNLIQNQPVHIALDARRGRAYHACGQYDDNGFQWLTKPSLLDVSAIAARDIPIIASESLSEPLPITQSLESLYQSIPASQQMARLISAEPTLFQCPWQSLIPLYLEEPNITLPKRNPAIIQTSIPE